MNTKVLVLFLVVGIAMIGAGWQIISSSTTKVAIFDKKREIKIQEIHASSYKFGKCKNGACTPESEITIRINNQVYTLHTIAIDRKLFRISYQFTSTNGKRLTLISPVTLTNGSTTLDIKSLASGDLNRVLSLADSYIQQGDSDEMVYVNTQFSDSDMINWEALLQFMDGKVALENEKSKGVGMENIQCPRGLLRNCKDGMCAATDFECAMTMDGKKYTLRAVQAISSPAQIIFHWIQKDQKEMKMVFSIDVGGAPMRNKGLRTLHETGDFHEMLQSSDRYTQVKKSPDVYALTSGNLYCYNRVWFWITNMMNVSPKNP